MAIQLRRSQIINAAINADKMDLSSGTFNFSSAVLQAATPSADAHVATKGYVDGLVQGLDIKDSVKAATTANITLSGTQTIDTISCLADDRVLVKNQSTPSQNGLYLVKAGTWVRTDDLEAGADAAGAFTFVEQGAVNGENGFVCTSNKGAAVVGTDALTFAQFNAAGQITAGAALTKTGNQLDVAVDDASIEVASDALRVKAAGISNDMLAGSISADKLAGSIGNAKLSNSSVSFGGVSVALGASDATPAFDLADATNYPTSALVGTITNAQLAGSIAASKLAGSIGNDKLSNSAVSIGGVSVALGGSVAQPALDLTNATAYPTSSLTGTITNAQLAGSIAASKLAGSIGNDKLSNSTISGIALGSNLNDLTVDDSSLQLDSGTTYTGAAAKTISIKPLGVTAAMLAGSIGNDKLSNSAVSLGGVSVALGGAVAQPSFDLTNATNYPTSSLIGTITNAQLAGSIDESKLSSGIPIEKIQLQTNWDALSPDGSATNFDLSRTIPQGFDLVIVVRNGVVQKQVASSPSADEYTVNRNGGAGGVGRVTMGSAVPSGEDLRVFYMSA